ncbi:cyclohexa-1,5-dienecarbonyl-CoA hydratase [Sedimenticola hydrogenitrophicus]|uniref:cyclohexa-1,5-dienecarbonyl-CoA hydratase n=1 Tax=Sedimenticola hydrogenitrophicus TaxID=2967975 RepID=UPI0023AFFACD|nr:cyclohexa-1,5-dienecarbonyl-CoA hydratase [Sedimenticola hydrogenitrophicus]
MSDSPLKVWMDRDGALLRLRLNRPKANIVDAAMIGALQSAFEQYAGQAALRAVLLDAEGPHFSFGASVEEHLPGSCAEMLRSLHRLIETMLDFPLPILVAIQGQCLGGGLEVAAAGSQLFAASDARLGQPEIQLAVFAPAASCLLPERIGQAQAEDLLFSGRSVNSDEALRMGLVNQVAADPQAAAIAYFDKFLAPHSASSLRFAVQAVRSDMVARIKAKLASVEALYLDGLMASHDAVEGLNAFIEKRPAKWEDS